MQSRRRMYFLGLQIKLGHAISQRISLQVRRKAAKPRGQVHYLQFVKIMSLNYPIQKWVL
jgi:hypothetical protein